MAKNNKRPPRVYLSEYGRFIKVNGKRVYIKSGMSNKQLVKKEGVKKRKKRFA